MTKVQAEIAEAMLERIKGDGENDPEDLLATCQAYAAFMEGCASAAELVDGPPEDLLRVLNDKVLELCGAISEIPTGVAQTKADIMADKLFHWIVDLMNAEKANE